MRTVRFTFALIVTTTCVSFPQLSATSDASGLTLVGPATISLTDEAPRAFVKICNSSAGVAAVSVKKTGTAAMQEALKVVGPQRVASGACGSYKVARMEDAAPAEELQGLVSFVAPGAGLASVEVTIKAATTAGAFQDSLGPDTFHATGGDHWFGDDARLDDSRLALRFTDGAVDVEAKDWSFSDGQHRITVKGMVVPQDLDDAVKRYHLRIVDKNVPAGEYKGVLSFSDDDEGDVPITIEVDDSRFLLALILAMGVFLGALGRFVSGRWRIGARLERQRSGLNRLYDVTLAAPWSNRFRRPTTADVQAWCAVNKAQQKQFTRRTAVIDPDDPAFAKVVQALADVEADAEVFRTDLAESLKALNDEWATTQKYIDDRLPSIPKPDIAIESVNGVLVTLRDPSVTDLSSPSGKLELGIGQASLISTKATALTETVIAWRAALEHVIRLAQWAMALEAGGVDSRALAAAKRSLWASAAALWPATDVERIDDVLDGADMTAATASLMELAMTIDEPPGIPFVSEPSETWAGMGKKRKADRDLRFQNESTLTKTPAVQTRIDHDYVDTVRNVIRWLVDVSPLALTSVVAFLVTYLATVETIYDTQTFMTWGTGLAVVLAGLAATTVIDAAISAISWSRSGLASLIKAK